MTSDTTGQTTFERYLRGELPLHEAADAVTALIMERKLNGESLTGLRMVKPQGIELTEEMVSRADAFFDEMNRRGRGG